MPLGVTSLRRGTGPCLGLTALGFLPRGPVFGLPASRSQPWCPGWDGSLPQAPSPGVLALGSQLWGHGLRVPSPGSQPRGPSPRFPASGSRLWAPSPGVLALGSQPQGPSPGVPALGSPSPHPEPSPEALRVWLHPPADGFVCLQGSVDENHSTFKRVFLLCCCPGAVPGRQREMKPVHHLIPAAGPPPAPERETLGSCPSAARPHAVSCPRQTRPWGSGSPQRGGAPGSGPWLANNGTKAAKPAGYGSLLRVCLGTAALLPSLQPNGARQHRPCPVPTAASGSAEPSGRRDRPPARCGRDGHPARLPAPRLLPARPGTERLRVWTSSRRERRGLEISVLDTNLMHSTNALIYPFVTIFDKRFCFSCAALIKDCNRF